MRKISVTKISKQRFEIKLERFPPECGENKGMIIKIEDVIQKRQITEITLL